MTMAYFKCLFYININYNNLQVKSFIIVNQVSIQLKNKIEIIIAFGFCEFCAILSLFACSVTYYLEQDLVGTQK